jgi:hypothetical protein
VVNLVDPGEDLAAESEVWAYRSTHSEGDGRPVQYAAIAPARAEIVGLTAGSEAEADPESAPVNFSDLD